MPRVSHPIPPVYDENSKVLILGSFPSVKSREQMFFYGHPRNRFWSVLAAVFNTDIPTDVEEKKRLLLENRVAVWDVIASCDIEGSSDATIRNVVVNDISRILKSADIRRIIVNGKTAKRYYDKYMRDAVGRECVCMPSTSPANAAWSQERLIECWSGVLK